MKTSNQHRFSEALCAAYRTLFLEPEYALAAARTTPAELSEKMTQGLSTGGADKDGKAVQQVIREFGIKNTYKAIREFLNTPDEIPAASAPQENPEQEQQEGESGFYQFTYTVSDKNGTWGTMSASARDSFEAVEKLRDFASDEADIDMETVKFQMTVETALELPITLKRHARELFTALAAAGLTHNPDNDPSQSTVERDGVVSLMFTEAQAILLRQRLKQCIAVCGSHDAVMEMACECYGIASETPAPFNPGDRVRLKESARYEDEDGEPFTVVRDEHPERVILVSDGFEDWAVKPQEIHKRADLELVPVETAEAVETPAALRVTLTDEETLVSAAGRFGHQISVYDDGSGPLWVHRDSMGISGIVRAESFETAYGICEDEFFPEASETWEELVEEYGKTRDHVKIIRRDGVERNCKADDYPLASGEFVRWETRETTPDTAEKRSEAVNDNELFQEAFGYRPNGPNKSDEKNHGIYAKDLNGDRLSLLTPELAAELEITLEISAR